jgi:predicted ester cyclase
MAEATRSDSKPRRRARKASAASVAEGYFSAVAARDLQAMSGFWDDEIVADVVPIGIFRGPVALRAFFAELFVAVPDFDFAVRRIVADGDRASVEWRMSGTFEGGPFQGLEPTGRRIELRGVDCLEVAGERISHNAAYYDGAAFARAIGMLPAQDSGAERALTAGFNALTKLRRTLKETNR